MTAAEFPHAYPFRFVDTVSQRADPDSSLESGGRRALPA